MISLFIHVSCIRFMAYPKITNTIALNKLSSCSVRPHFLPQLHVLIKGMTNRMCATEVSSWIVCAKAMEAYIT